MAYKKNSNTNIKSIRKLSRRRAAEEIDSLTEVKKKDVHSANNAGIQRNGDIIPEGINKIKETHKKRTGRFSMQKKHSRQLPLQDKTFVFTGELENYTTKEAKEAVELLGARAASSVSSNTDYVVTGENPGSELGEAKGRNIKIMNENEFQKLLKNK